MKNVICTVVFLICCVAIVVTAYRFVLKQQHENFILKQIVQRLEADSRIAEVMVTGVNFNEDEMRKITIYGLTEYILTTTIIII